MNHWRGQLECKLMEISVRRGHKRPSPVSPLLRRLYELWDEAQKPTEKAIEARRMVTKQEKS